MVDSSSGSPTAGAWACSASRGMPCRATRSWSAVTVVSRPTTRTSVGARRWCRVQAASLPPLRARRISVIRGLCLRGPWMPACAGTTRAGQGPSGGGDVAQFPGAAGQPAQALLEQLARQGGGGDQFHPQVVLAPRDGRMRIGGAQRRIDLVRLVLLGQPV